MEPREEALWDSQYPNCSKLPSTIITIFAIIIVHIQNHMRQTFLAASAKQLRVELPQKLDSIMIAKDVSTRKGWRYMSMVWDRSGTTSAFTILG